MGRRFKQLHIFETLPTRAELEEIGCGLPTTLDNLNGEAVYFGLGIFSSAFGNEREVEQDPSPSPSPCPPDQHTSKERS